MSADLDYAVGEELDQPTVRDGIESTHHLRRWMENCITSYEQGGPGFEESEPRGRIYIARTIQYQSDTGLAQTGSAPNFFGGLWSLATCKKGMRRSNSFQKLFRAPNDDGVRRPKQPVFIFACASRSKAYDKPERADSHRNWLASAAMVTHGFDRMEDYGRYLLETHEGPAMEKRLTHASDRPGIAEDRGDCHVDETGQVHYPPANHQHGDGEVEATCGCTSQSSGRDPDDHIDNSDAHIKCIAESEYWLGWTEPRFALVPEEEFNVGHKNTREFDDILARFEQVGWDHR